MMPPGKGVPHQSGPFLLLLAEVNPRRKHSHRSEAKLSHLVARRPAISIAKARYAAPFGRLLAANADIHPIALVQSSRTAPLLACHGRRLTLTDQPSFMVASH